MNDNKKYKIQKINNKDISNIIFNYIKKDKWLFITLLILSYVFYLKTITVPSRLNLFFISIKNNNQPKQIQQQLFYLFILIIIIFILLSIFDYVKKQIEHRSHTYFIKYINSKIINTLEHNYKINTDSIFYINQTSLAHKIQYLFLNILEVFPFFIILVSILYFIYSKNIPYTILIFIIGSIICIYLYYKQIYKLINIRNQSLYYRDNIIKETDDLNNNKYTIYSFNKYDNYPELNRNIKQFQKLNTNYYQTDFKSFYIIWYSYFIIFAIIIYIYYRHQQNIVDIILIALLFLGTEVIKRIWHFNATFLTLGEIKYYLSKLNNYIYQLNDNNNENNKKDKIYNRLNNLSHYYLIKNIPENNIILKIKNLYYKYPNSQKYILDNINLSIQYNKITTITGNNGCGKSTLLKILYGIYHPNKGSIIINHKYINNYRNINYQNIVIDNIKKWRQFIHYREQYAKLFNTTVYNNLIYGNVNNSKTISNLNINKDIFKDIIDKKDNNVSGGQTQIISLFRLLNYHKPIILLDEPTSALDKKTKQQFFKLLDTLKNKATIIIISHDKDIFQKSDKIINL